MWWRDALCGGVVVEVVEGGELGCTGGDGVSGLVQELAELRPAYARHSRELPAAPALSAGETCP